MDAATYSKQTSSAIQAKQTMLFKLDPTKVVGSSTANQSKAMVTSFDKRARVSMQAAGNGQTITRGMDVRIMRPESYWFQECGKVATVDTKGENRYGVVVRFDKVNYAGVATNNFSLDELVPVGGPPAPKAKAVAAPVALSKVADSGNQAKAISKNENISKF